MKHIFIILAFLGFFLSGCTNHSPPIHQDYQTLLDQEDVKKVVNELFIQTDNRDWEKVKSTFAPQVAFDMTSLAGGTPGTLTRQQIVDAWEKGLRPLQSIHHLIGNFIIDIEGDKADVFCYGIASHHLPNKTKKNLRHFAGSYNIALQRTGTSWKITHFKYNSKYVEGNLKLEENL